MSDLYKVLSDAKNQSPIVEDEMAYLDYAHFEYFTENDLSISEGKELYTAVFEKALFLNEQSILEHALRTGLLNGILVYNALIFMYPQPSEKRTQITRHWCETLLHFKHYELLFEVVQMLNDRFLESEDVYSFYYMALKGMPEEKLLAAIENELPYKLEELELGGAIGYIFEMLIERGIPELDIVKAIAVTTEADEFAQILGKSPQLKTVFEDPIQRWAVFEHAVRSLNVSVLQAHLEEIDNEDKANRLLIAACEAGQNSNVEWIISVFIQNSWAIDERCLFAGADLAGCILQRGLRIKGGTLKKVGEDPVVASQVIESLVEYAIPQEDPVRELRIKVLTNPEGLYHYPHDDEIIELARILRKQNIVHILEEKVQHSTSNH